MKLMKQLAVALEVPTSATPDDLKQLISGRLEEMEREPMNVQVLVQETPRGLYLSLQDMDGVFVQVEPPDIEKEDEPSDIEREDQEAELGEANVKEVSALYEAVEQANEDKGLLQDEVRELKHEIDRLKIRLRELRGASCEQVVEHDKEISSKNEEIASLKERLGRLPLSILEVSDTVVTRPVPPLPLPSVSTEHEAVCIASTG